MASPIALKGTTTETLRERSAATARTTPVWRTILAPFASLKLTVVLFALSIFLVFASTLAQKELDVWDVIHGWYRVDETKLLNWEAPYFHASQLFVRIPLQIFFPDTFFPHPPQTTLGFWFPRGWLLGLFMAVNLIAAHAVRFTVQAKGSRLWGGVGVLALGCLATWLAIHSGASDHGILEGAMIEWSLLWKLLLLGLAAITFGAGAAFFMLMPERRIEKVLAATTAGICGGVLGYALVNGQAAQITPESMRILWQLLKGTAAGLVLLAGCQMVFKKRAGIVLLHGGVGLMFLYEVIVGTRHDEAQMPLFEGTKSNWVHDVRAVEFAVIERRPDNKDGVTVVPQSLLKDGELLDLPDVPFKARVVKFYKNSKLRTKGPHEPTPATHGLGDSMTVDELKPVSGVDAGKMSDQAAMYVELVDKDDDKKSLGTYLVGVEPWYYGFMTGMFPTDALEVGGKEYQLEMRFKRTYKPYVIKALKVSKDDYLASDKPRNYSSLLHVVDDKLGVDRQESIKMNNPMRFSGETFYQSGFNKIDDLNITTILVVANDSWMLPYVSCMIVAVGMVVQFGGTLSRFLTRRLSGGPVAAIDVPVETKPRKGGPKHAAARATVEAPVDSDASSSFWARWGLPVAGIAFIAAMIGKTVVVPQAKPEEMDFYAFGKLPVAYESRVKPFDSLARSTLVTLSHRQTFKENLDDAKEPSKPATKWLLDVITRSPKVDDYRVFRIDNLDALNALRLERNQHSRYSLNELLGNGEELQKQIELVKFKDELSGVLTNSAQVQRQIELAKKRHDLDLTSLLTTVKDYQLRIDAMKSGEKVTRLKEFRAAAKSFQQQLEAAPKQRTDDDLKALASAAEPFQEQLRTAVEKYTGMETYEREILKLNSRTQTYRLVEAGFFDPGLVVPSMAELRAEPDKIAAKMEDLQTKRQRVASLSQYLKDGGMKPPLGVPVGTDDWQTYSDENLKLFTAGIGDFMAQIDPQFKDPDRPKNNPAAEKLHAIFAAYKANDAKAFNAGVADYRDYLASVPPKEYDAERRDLEAYLNHADPFFWASYLYLLPFLVACCAWLGFTKPLNRTALAMIAAVFAYHTVSLILRMYVTERPPVTNLYSSAVFIGWGAVLLGMILEGVYKIGVGNIMASIAGFGSLQIAYLLTRQGDTIEALEAVLDTQFWLTTHVVCVTLGYATTFGAGLLGFIFLVLGLATPVLTSPISKIFSRMIYGTLCFALFFSFVGTVLGGLWADDSWGRFWGWDPKENGALIIVLWNALVLHARWGGMIKDRGLAVLAVAGNITTSWSWFGVNQLGVGLHSYGFSAELLSLLFWFVVGSAAIVAVGLIPRRLWLSGEGRDAT